MTDDRTLPPEAPDPDLTAAELALGLLEGDERATALRRTLADPAFAREVERWRAHFAQLFADWPEVTPPAHLFPEIERTLDRPTAPVVRRSSKLWPAATGIATLVAASLALVLLLRPAPLPTPVPVLVPAQPGLVLVAQLAPAEKGSAAKPVAAYYDTASATLRVAAAPLAGAGKAAELWAIPADGVPRALGMLDAAAATPVPVGADKRPLLAAGVTLAVSIEPPGGSPTGKPTGPVVATGTLALV